MSYDAISRTYQIIPNKKVKAKSYNIEISLSDNFLEENFYSFYVIILPKLNEKEIIKEKKMSEVQGIFKLQKIFRDSTAELRL